MVVEVGEEGRAVHALEGRPALAHGLEQALGGVVVDLAAHAQRAGHALELLAERREREAPAALFDDVLEREPAQDARERGRVSADRLRDLGAGARAAGQRPPHAELRRDVEQLRRDEAVHQAEELPLRFDPQ